MIMDDIVMSYWKYRSEGMLEIVPTFHGLAAGDVINLRGKLTKKSHSCLFTLQM